MCPSNRSFSLLSPRPFSGHVRRLTHPPLHPPLSLCYLQSPNLLFPTSSSFHLHIILALHRDQPLAQMHPILSLEPAHLRPDTSTHSDSSIVMTQYKNGASSHPDSSDNNSSSGRPSMSIRVVRSAPSLLTLDDYNLISLGYKPASPLADIVYTFQALSLSLYCCISNICARRFLIMLGLV